MEVCPICGGTGITPDYEICSCQRVNSEEVNDTNLGFEIPECYKLKFDGLLMSEPYNKKYGEEMNNIYREYCSQPSLNYFIHFPPNTGKTVFMYSLLANASNSLTRFKPSSLKELEPELKSGNDISDIVSSDILIIYLEDVFPIYTQQVISTVLSERIRRNKKTLILSNTSWEVLTKRFPGLNSYKGDGNFKTFKVLEGIA